MSARTPTERELGMLHEVRLGMNGCLTLDDFDMLESLECLGYLCVNSETGDMELTDAGRAAIEKAQVKP